jgi:hypothetical protein
LDFINTKTAVDGRPVDLLEKFTNLLEWLCKAGFLSKEEADMYEQRWESSGIGEHIVTVARALRSSLFAMIEKVKNGENASEEYLENINNLLKEQVITTKLVMKDNVFSVKGMLGFKSRLIFSYLLQKQQSIFSVITRFI